METQDLLGEKLLWILMAVRVLMEVAHFQEKIRQKWIGLRPMPLDTLPKIW